MTRKDLIIVSVVVNAGLLVVLFISAIKSEKTPERIVSNVEKERVEAPKVAEISAPVVSTREDRVDHILHQYSVKSSQEEKKEPELLPTLTLQVPKAESRVPTSLVSPYRTVTVEKGDVLEKIAKTYGVTVDEIMRLNHLQNSRLQIGQTLKLPVKEEKLSVAKGVEDEGNYYIVKGGDNPWTIAQKNGMQVEELLRLNKMDAEKAKKLRPGDRLKIK
jgi:peptidoglycan endopeptidase LytF